MRARAWYDKKVRGKGGSSTGDTPARRTVEQDYTRSGCMTDESLSLEVRPCSAERRGFSGHVRRLVGFPKQVAVPAVLRDVRGKR